MNIYTCEEIKWRHFNLHWLCIKYYYWTIVLFLLNSGCCLQCVIYAVCTLSKLKNSLVYTEEIGSLQMPWEEGRQFNNRIFYTTFVYRKFLGSQNTTRIIHFGLIKFSCNIVWDSSKSRRTVRYDRFLDQRNYCRNVNTAQMTTLSKKCRSFLISFMVIK